MIIDKSSELIKNPSGLTFYDGNLFIAEFQKGTIKKYNLAKKKMETFYTEDPPIYDLKMMTLRESGMLIMKIWIESSSTNSVS